MKSIKRGLLSLVLLVFLLPNGLIADEGMWLPLLLKDQKFSQMREMGLKLSAQEIYSINNACLKDAVIGLMGEGANLRSYGTASFVSDSGLIITNYHVVMSYIERFSTQENDFLKYGYWAQKRSEESLCRGLYVKQLIRMADVTEEILEGTQGLAGREKQSKIDANGVKIAERETKGTKYEVKMQSLFGNSQYIMNIYIVYRDVRMVAAPPMAIAKFGGNSDNYKWPRHTGDFALLRVYANNENLPASFSKKNRPYKPVHFLPISAKGVKENDFIMIIGYPGSTREYIPSFALEKIIYDQNAHKVAIRKEKLNIINSALEENPSLKFRYTTNLSSIGNSYLRWKGEIMGVTRMNLVSVKQEEEKLFNKWANSTPERANKYGSVLKEMQEHYKAVAQYNLAFDYFNEAGINGSEIVPFIGKFEKLAAIYSRKTLDSKSAQNETKRLIGLTHQFFNNWDYEIDRKMFRNLMVRYYDNMLDKFKSDAMIKYLALYNGDVEKLTKEVFENSMLTNKEKLISFLENPDRDVQKEIKEDALYELAIGYYMINVDRIVRQRGDLQARLLELNELYLEGYLEMNKDKMIYPDANNSQRVSYGKVIGANAQDGLWYEPFTTLDGAISKHLNNIEDPEFYIPKKIRDLQSDANYGNYSNKDNVLYVNFLTNAHTTSGNSGSPVINAKGELVGLNFDRIWEGVSSDYRYSKVLSRSIAVDIRYVLFILENYSPSKYVFNELFIK